MLISGAADSGRFVRSKMSVYGALPQQHQARAEPKLSGQGPRTSFREGFGGATWAAEKALEGTTSRLATAAGRAEAHTSGSPCREQSMTRKRHLRTASKTEASGNPN
jgi:hypothetical protein